MSDLIQPLVTLLGPVATLAVLALFGLAGFKRLTQYDQELRHIRDKVDEHSKTLRDEVRADFQSMRTDISAIAERALANIVSKQEDEQRRRVEQWRAEVDAIVDKLARYDFLRGLARPEQAAQLKERMGSLDEVHTVVSSLFQRARSEGERREAINLVRTAIEQKIPGDHDDYHNMAAELAKRNYPHLALEILEEGMQRFPGSPDLIGSAMQYAVGNGEMGKAGEYFDGLKKLGDTAWNWRAFTFAVKYQATKGDADATRTLYEAACKQLPDEERPAVQYAQLFQRRGQTAQAIKVLEETIARVPTAPQSALQLSEYYKDQGQYEKAMAMGQRALAMDALDQSRINNAAAHLTIGLAGERLWLEGADSPAERRIAPHTFLAHYAAALGAPDCPPFVRRAVETRSATVRGQLRAEGASSAAIDALFAEAGLGETQDGKANPELSRLLMSALREASAEAG
jgi:tetratricopeptide (TPR) repeat protein